MSVVQTLARILVPCLCLLFDVYGLCMYEIACLLMAAHWFLVGLACTRYANMLSNTPYTHKPWRFLKENHRILVDTCNHYQFKWIFSAVCMLQVFKSRLIRSLLFLHTLVKISDSNWFTVILYSVLVECCFTITCVMLTSSFSNIIHFQYMQQLLWTWYWCVTAGGTETS